MLTTGGFVDDERMLADHAPALLGHGKVSDGLDDGSGILMAQEIGAATRRMHAHEVALTCCRPWPLAASWSTRTGSASSTKTPIPARSATPQSTNQPGPYWVVVDERGFEDVPEADRWGVRPTHVAETLAELEQDLAMPSGSLAMTVTASTAVPTPVRTRRSRRRCVGCVRCNRRTPR